MALPTYDRSSGKLLSGTNSSSLNNTVPNPKGGLPIFVRENNVNTSIKEIPSSIENPIDPKKDKTASSILSNIPIIKGLTENKTLGPKVTSAIDTVSNKLGLNDNLNTIDSIINNPISQTNRSVKNTLGLSILDSLRGMASQLTGVVGKSFANNAEMKKGWEEIYRNQGISDKNNPYTKDKEPMLDKLVGFDIHGTIAGKAQQLKSKLDTDASQYIETELSKDPFNKTFAGKTTRAVGGMIPQVVLSFMRTPTAILSLSEAGMNAEQSYKENIDKGISPDDAKSTAVKQLGADLLGTYFTNKLGSLGSIEKAIAGKVKGGIAKGILNYFKDTGLEVAQETYQQFLQNIATDKPWGEGLSETAKLTIIPAMLFGAAGPIANIKNTEEMSDVQKAVAANEVANKIRDKQMEEGQGNPDIVADSELNEIADIASMNAQAKIAEAGTDYDTVLKEIGISKELQSNIIQPINTDNNIIPVDTQVVPTPEVVPDQTQEQEKISSRVFERLQKENPSILDGDLEATKVNLKKDAEKAVALVEKDKQLAYDIAIGKDVSSDVTSTAVNIALAEKALQEGNNSLYAKLIKARSLAQTRRGQEIVAEKGSVNDNSTSKYVKELINLKLEKLGSNYLSDLKDRAKNISLKGKSKKQRGTDILNEKVDQVEKKIKAKKLDTKTAIKLLEELKCI